MNTVLLSNLFSLPRIVYAMAADGLFFQVFARVHPRTQVPMVGILVFGVLMALLSLLLDLEALVQFLSIGTLLAYTFVAASIIVLRFQKASPPSSPGPASPGPIDKGHSSFSDHLQLVQPWGCRGVGARHPGGLGYHPGLCAGLRGLSPAPSPMGLHPAAPAQRCRVSAQPPDPGGSPAAAPARHFPGTSPTNTCCSQPSRLPLPFPSLPSQHEQGLMGLARPEHLSPSLSAWRGNICLQNVQRKRKAV
ncbi:PREDICTED: cationic amino acid transporter 4-like isoform X2 [Galeopterus variegatus]|uniref:Cationic amino acid transporter 4-like isoform X2 n=1 Tax=Galeopterus variegatus TaxID=482537 RepID=A0ABM0PZ37_GALVR|nr:PREDICTED: cationic amino acid transporter 4-like isoform X2 [Galeopterus variegatus]